MHGWRIFYHKSMRLMLTLPVGEASLYVRHAIGYNTSRSMLYYSETMPS